MDNIENANPSGEADVTASQGQFDATDTQPETNEKSVDGGTQEATGTASNPWDNDPKFKGKAPEDIYKAYKEAEKLTGQLSQKAQIANLIEEKYGVTPERLKAQIEQQELEAQRQRYADNPLAPIVDEVHNLKQQLEAQSQEKALMQVESELDSFIKENPAYEGQRDKIKKLALTPGIGYDPETGEDIATFDDIAREYFGEVRAQGQQDAYNKIETKILTQTTGASSSPQRKFSPEDMKNMSAREMEAILPRA